MRKVWIGTSGWTYDSWRGPFYPEELPKKRWLEFYAARFPTTEVNGSFYRTPSPWVATARHVYVRGHGPGGRYRDNYPDATLRASADHIRKWRRQGREVLRLFRQRPEERRSRRRRAPN